MLVCWSVLSVVRVTAPVRFVSSLVNLWSLNLGFVRDHVLMVALEPARSGYTGEQLARGYHELLYPFQSIPGVRSASLCWIAPVSGAGTMFAPSSIEGYTYAPGESRTIYFNWVATRYFN